MKAAYVFRLNVEGNRLEIKKKLFSLIFHTFSFLKKIDRGLLRSPCLFDTYLHSRSVALYVAEVT